MKKHNILLVDDDEINTFYVQYKLMELEQVGEIVISVNGQEALDNLASSQQEGTSIDIILLDVNMPIMNGFEFLDIYQNSMAMQLPNTKVYIVTTSNDIKDSNRAKEYACVEGYINKSEIVNLVSSILQKL